MYFQQRYLRKATAFDATTCLQTIDLPKTGFLTGIEIYVAGTNGNNAAKPDVWLHDRIKKFEVIVNGSKVVKSLDGPQLLADMLYKKTPHFSHDMKNMNAASCEELFYINMGRHYHDLDFMLDLSRVADPQLRLDCDFTITSANGWSNGVAMSAAPSFSVICHLLRDGGVSPRGYIKTAEAYRFTSGASKSENMTVPRGPVYSNLYVQSWYKAQGLGYLLDTLELNINNDALIPISVGPIELAAQITRMYGLHHMSQQLALTGGQQYPFPLEQAVVEHIAMGLIDAESTHFDIWGNAAAPGFRKTSDGVTPVTSNYNVLMALLGIWPFSMSPIPYFDPWDERTWINSAVLGDFWVKFLENASGGTSAVIKLIADEVVTKYESV